MRPTRRALVGLTGIAATVLLHSLFFAVAIWEGGHLLLRPRPPMPLALAPTPVRPKATLASAA